MPPAFLKHRKRVILSIPPMAGRKVYSMTAKRTPSH
jgi:hypothetical protein